MKENKTKIQPSSGFSSEQGLSQVIDRTFERLGLAIAGFGQNGERLFNSSSVNTLTSLEWTNISELIEALEITSGYKRELKQNFFEVRHTPSESRMLELRIAAAPGKPQKTFVTHIFATDTSGISPIVLSMEDTSMGSRARLEIEELTRLAALGQIAAGVAHEFNNILTSVLGWAQIAKQNTNDGETLSTALEIIEGNARRAKEIAAKLLDSSHSTIAHKETLSISEVVDDVLKLLSWEMKTVGIHVTRRFEPVAACWGDSNQLSQVFINIVRNSMDAMPEGGGLHVSIEQENKEIVVTFIDSGSGMPEEVRNRIFDPFFSTKTRPKNGRPGGTGLGLAISKDIVEEHNGKLEVSSEPGKGTVFSLKLQASGSRASVSEPPQPDMHSIPPGTSVLVADDEPDIGEMVHTALTLKGVNVMSATRGQEALELCQKHSFNAAFVDFTMPGLSGHNLGKELVAVQPEMAIIYMSGREVEMSSDVDAADFLKKPFDLNDIQGKLRELLDPRKDKPSSVPPSSTLQ